MNIDKFIETERVRMWDLFEGVIDRMFTKQMLKVISFNIETPLDLHVFWLYLTVSSDLCIKVTFPCDILQAKLYGHGIQEFYDYICNKINSAKGKYVL